MKAIYYIALLCSASGIAFAADSNAPEAQTVQSQSSRSLEETIITSSRVEMPMRYVATAVTVIDREELELKGNAALADILRTQTSIGVSNSGGLGKVTSLRIRGEEGYRTKVLVDGVDISDPTSLQSGPQIEHLSNSYDIERVEILRGPQGFIYGADSGGVVNIITRSESDGFSGGLSTQSGSFGTLNIAGQLSGGNEVVDFSAGVTNTDTDGFNSRVEDNLSPDDDGGENTTAHVKTGWNASENLRFELIHRDVSSDAEFDQCFTPAFSRANNCDSKFDQRISKLNAIYEQGSNSHQLSYSISDTERDSLTDGVSGFATEGERREAGYLGNFALSDKQRLIFGADYEEDEITATGSEGERDQLGIFAEFQQILGDSLHLTAGLRHDDSSLFGRHNSFRISSAYTQELANGSALKYRATYGTGFRAPSLSEQAYNDGPFAFGDSAGLQLSEENSRGYDIGFDYISESGLFAGITFFDQRIEDEIAFNLETFAGYEQADGEGKSQGIEVEIEYPVLENLVLSANLTYNEAETRDDLPRLRRPEQLANLGIIYLTLDEKLRILANVRISRDAEDIDAGNRVPLDDYEVLNLSISYSLTPELEVFARGENLGDANYQEITNFNTAERAGYLGARYSF